MPNQSGRFAWVGGALDPLAELTTCLRDLRPLDFFVPSRVDLGPLRGNEYIGYVVEQSALADVKQHLRAPRNAGILVLIDCEAGGERPWHGLERALVVDPADARVRPELFSRTVRRFIHDALEHERRAMGIRGALFDLSDGELTAAELAVAELVVRDLGRREIARTLGIAERTVATHMTRILMKCGGTGKRGRWLREQIGRVYDRTVSSGDDG